MKSRARYSFKPGHAEVGPLKRQEEWGALGQWSSARESQAASREGGDGGLRIFFCLSNPV